MYETQQTQVFESPTNLNSSGLTAEQSNENQTISPGRGANSTSPRESTDVNSSSRPVRVPGTYPPVWLPDSESNNCMSCDSLFTLIKRRHHCRSCGKIFCGDCCRLKAKLLYLDNKEARVCTNCFHLLDCTINSDIRRDSDTLLASPIDPNRSREPGSSSATTRVQGVLKTSNTLTTINECNSSSSSSDQQMSKQVMFADGVRPGTDLSENFPRNCASSSSSLSNQTSSSFSLLSRQSKDSDGSSSRRVKGGKSLKNITVCDELGYLPPLVICKESALYKGTFESNSSQSSSLTDLISQFKSIGNRKNIQASMESRSCPLNSIMKFEEISDLVGTDGVITFLLLKDYQLRVKIVNKTCCIDKDWVDQDKLEEENLEPKQIECNATSFTTPSNQPQYWCFASDGLSRFGHSEVLLVVDKDRNDSCIPRDVFKVYLTLHELALRRQSLETLGNLLFPDGLFGSRDTAGLLFVLPLQQHCMKNLVLPKRMFLVALVLQRWEVPWSKVFPMRLLLRLGHKFNSYPYPIVSYRVRDPVYYEVGHTIISILGDFRNFRYSMTHVDGLRVIIDKRNRKVSVRLNHSCYQQFNKVLDSSNNEHVLAWSASSTDETDGHLVSVQNEDGHYETVEFYRPLSQDSQCETSEEVEKNRTLSASFIIFSGALKVDQSGQSAKISIVEDGLLVQIQSCTMSALKSAIHFMHYFDIECGAGSENTPLNSIEIIWDNEHSGNPL